MGIVGVVAQRLAVECCRIDVHAVSGPEQISEHQADDERDGRHHLEIDQRLDADPADLFEIAGTCDAMHDDTKYDRRDDHRDQFQKSVAKYLQPDSEVGCGDAEHDAEQQGDQHLYEKGCVKWLARRSDGGRGEGRAGEAGHGLLRSSHWRNASIGATNMPFNL